PPARLPYKVGALVEAAAVARAAAAGAPWRSSPPSLLRRGQRTLRPASRLRYQGFPLASWAASSSHSSCAPGASSPGADVSARQSLGEPRAFVPGGISQPKGTCLRISAFSRPGCCASQSHRCGVQGRCAPAPGIAPGREGACQVRAAASFAITHHPRAFGLR
ncbi:Hypothetical predicted protein, partial [Marmota monax]